MMSIHRGLLLGVLIAALAGPVAAQQSSTVTQADIQRLQDNVYLADRDVSQARSRDTARATQLQAELDDLRDEVVYLKVKLRKERTLSRSEYADVRDRIDDLRSRARGDSPSPVSSSSSSSSTSSSAAAAPAPAPRPPAGTTAAAPASSPSASTSTATASSRSTATAPAGTVEIPVGTEIDVRLQSALNSGTNQVEDRVEAYAIRGTVSQAIEGEGIRGETARIGTGAGVGAIIGGILGGFKGAMAGILIGGGGTIAATEGKEVQIPQGSVLRVRLDSPAYVAPPAR